VRPAVIALALLLVFAATALPKDRKPVPPVPDHFVIGRDTFFDFGPPFHYSELLFVNSDGDGTSIERVMLTAGYKCTLDPKIEVAKASMKQSVAELFGTTNPCKIPERDLHRELKRRKHDLVFSGANISMQVQCGGQSRIIRSDILDRDMFDTHAGTPEYTSWTMRTLGQLDRAIGPGAMDKPMIALPGDSNVSAQPADSPMFQEIGTGKYDSLFPGTSHRRFTCQLRIQFRLRQLDSSRPRPSNRSWLLCPNILRLRDWLAWREILPSRWTSSQTAEQSTSQWNRVRRYCGSPLKRHRTTGYSPSKRPDNTWSLPSSSL
jgi:hypothetical protein